MDTKPISDNKLDEWLELIRNQKMPIFDRTMHRVIAISRDDMAPVSELADVVLQDSSLTARVLKLANSSYYNPTSAAIGTVTRAIIVLGFNAVRNICLTLTLVDALVKGAARERLCKELALAMHGATQARALAEIRGDRSPEEVFIATLLYRIGELAFWCYGGETGDELDRIAGQPGLTPEQAQDRVLGFRLSQLSRQLIGEWRLTDLLRDAVACPSHHDERIRTVMLGQQIARCAANKGWRSDEMDKLTRAAAELSELSPEETRGVLLASARAAADVAVELGASYASRHIPQPGSHPAGDRAQVAASPGTSPYPAADHSVQIRILRELSRMREEGKGDFNLIMELTLEGILRGLGMDRAVFALTTPDKRIIRAKYVLGENAEHLTQGFIFFRGPGEPDVLFQVLDQKVPRWITAGNRADRSVIIPEKLTRLMGESPFLLAPMLVTGQCIGLLYADRGLSKRAMDGEGFDDFKHFAQQASQGLTLAASRSPQAQRSRD